MEYEKIKQIMEDMGNSKLTAMDIEFKDGTKISMKKELEEKVVEAKSPIKETNTVVTRIVEEKVKTEEENAQIITSPMVGTFYLKPAPDELPFVEIGKKVKKGDTVCIVEAMKLMNEIESEFDGKITEIYVKDGTAVEYGSKLFKVE